MSGKGKFKCARCGRQFEGTLYFLETRLTSDERCRDGAACETWLNREGMSAPDAVERELGKRIDVHSVNLREHGRDIGKVAQRIEHQGSVCETRNKANVRNLRSHNREIMALSRLITELNERVDGLVNTELEEKCDARNHVNIQTLENHWVEIKGLRRRMDLIEGQED